MHLSSETCPNFLAFLSMFGAACSPSLTHGSKIFVTKEVDSVLVRCEGQGRNRHATRNVPFWLTSENKTGTTSQGAVLLWVKSRSEVETVNK